MLEHVEIKSTRSVAAKSYLEWGKKLENPVCGGIVVFTRRGVGFVVGEEKGKTGNLPVLGGNQSDVVCIKSFTTRNVVGYRWPEGQASTVAALPLGTDNAATRLA